MMPTLPEKLLYIYARHFPIRRGKLRLVNSLWHHFVRADDTLRTAHLKMGGFSVRCDLREMLQRQFYFFGTYWLEESVLDCWRQFAQNAQMVFDVGANAGIFSLAALASNPRATVHAFEPTPDIAQGLRETAELNHISGLHVHDMALARASGAAHLNIFKGDDGSNEGMNFVATEPRTSWSLPIRTVSLDDFCSEHMIARIDLLKLDVQGNEAEVLAGAERLLDEHKIDLVFAELNWEANPDGCPATQSIAFLERHGFEFSEPAKRLYFRRAGGWTRQLSEVIAKRQV